jgi:hypothetical protein
MSFDLHPSDEDVEHQHSMLAAETTVAKHRVVADYKFFACT